MELKLIILPGRFTMIRSLLAACMTASPAGFLL
jgi:hypothetical protein